MPDLPRSVGFGPTAPPLDYLSRLGFEVTLIHPTEGGWVDPAAIQQSLRKDTLLVSVMHVNNETGVLQPLSDIIQILADHPSFFHVDAAQGFGKDIKALQHERIDFVSISGYKIYGPKGVGALIARRRGFNRPPLEPLFYGGGQERGLRPGTLPVPLIVGLGLAAELAMQNTAKRAEICLAYRRRMLNALAPLDPVFNGDSERTLPHVINISFPGIDSEALMVALKDEVAISNGSACTSQSYQPSHVLKAMKVPSSIIQGAIRVSWSHMTNEPNWSRVADIIRNLR